jgi:hypothetical protein
MRSLNWPLAGLRSRPARRTQTLESKPAVSESRFQNIEADVATAIDDVTQRQKVGTMSTYRVSFTTTSEEVVDAPNPYAAAAIVGGRINGGTIVNVTAAHASRKNAKKQPANALAKSVRG